jgi:hypothetical protein
MTIPHLAELDLWPYIDDRGLIPEESFIGKIGIFAIFDAAQQLQYVGYSRDVYLSLKQHLVRRPLQCHGFKAQLIDRPDRTLLTSISEGWLAQWREATGAEPIGNGADALLWSQDTEVRPVMTEAERSALEAADEAGKIQVLKQAARRLEAGVLGQLADRGLTLALRFDPKLKEQGRLGLKS